MLQINKVTMHHLTDLKEIIKDLSVTINPGDKVAIIGEEGNGKSTLLKWIMKDKDIEAYIHTEGELLNQFSKTLYLPQALPEIYLDYSVDDYFFGESDVLEIDYSLLYQLVGQLGFDGERLTSSQKLKELSGGEQIKVQLLKMLAKSPDLILLDEPSNNLDLESLEWLEQFIKTSLLTIMYISHDESLLSATATKVIHLELLRHKTIPVNTVSNLSYKDYIEQRQMKFEHQTQVGQKQREDYENQMDKHRRIESSVHDAQNASRSAAESRLLKKKMHNVKSMGRRFAKEKERFEDIPIQEDAILLKFSRTRELPAGKTILNLENDRVQIGERLLANNLNLHLKGPQKIGIVGKNGIGKSTWMKHLWTTLQNRTDISAGYMPQNYTDYLSYDDTPISFLSETGDKEELTQVMTYLGSMRFTADEMNHSVRALSGGQKAKLFLLKIDLMGHNVLLLDEPSRNFSPLSQEELRQLFKDFQGAIIAISHDRLFLKEVCDAVYEMTQTGFKLIDLKP